MPLLKASKITLVLRMIKNKTINQSRPSRTKIERNNLFSYGVCYGFFSCILFLIVLIATILFFYFYPVVENVLTTLFYFLGIFVTALAAVTTGFFIVMAVDAYSYIRDLRETIESNKKDFDNKISAIAKIKKEILLPTTLLEARITAQSVNLPVEDRTTSILYLQYKGVKKDVRFLETIKNNESESEIVRELAKQAIEAIECRKGKEV